MKIEGWITTDPDNYQFRKKGDDKRVITFKEFNVRNYNVDELLNFNQDNKQKFLDEYWNNPDYWIEKTIHLDNYTKEQAWNHVSGYYSSEEFEDMWNSTHDLDIIAECIFEQESGLY